MIAHTQTNICLWIIFKVVLMKQGHAAIATGVNTFHTIKPTKP